MIFCFTGTGNSKFVADALADSLDDEVVSLNDIIKNDLPVEFESEKPYIITCPIYAWRIPNCVDSFIRRATFGGSQKVYVVATMGSETGKADKYLEETFRTKPVEYKGFTGIPMVDNYINMSAMPDAPVIEETNRKALETIRFVAELIKGNRSIGKSDKTRLAGIKSGTINKIFIKHTNDPNFVVSDSCIGCGECERFCPANNIVMENGKPAFQKKCFSCYGCLHRCPKAAIDIKGKSEKRGRYVCPEYRKN